VGDTAAAQLHRLGIDTWGQLLQHYPRRYEDYSKLVSIADLQLGAVTIAGTVERIAARRSYRRKLTITEAIISDGTGTVKAVWFNQPHLPKSLPQGTEVVLSGNLEFKDSNLSLSSPLWEKADRSGANTGRILPIYPETEGLTSRQLRGFVSYVLPLVGADDVIDLLPLSIRDKHDLVSYIDALRGIHAPQTSDELAAAQHRLAFEELFMLQAASLLIKQDIQTEVAPQIHFNKELAGNYVRHLPFTLTDAQRAAAWQILQDIDDTHPMNRLLEGDVGSGKTVVAAMAASMAVAQDYQVALMVPTEILARQHAASLTKLLKPLGVQVALLVASQPKAERQSIEAHLRDGVPMLVIGTQALLTGSVEMPRLGLVIVDEQHRFGVNQRQILKQKAGSLPHLLSMTATPIPRSLMLTIYGDLDISILKELPAGRKKIVTKLVKAPEREQMYQHIDEQIAEGRQVFIVCPLIDPSDLTGAKSVKAEAERLQKTIFAHRTIEVLHGKLKADEKQDIMDRFVAGKIDILVTTTVIEVGVDVPNASIMLIEGAERFGLAALHQLRGRVGRGQHQAYCYLAPATDGATSTERLRAMERTTDGFRLAQIDLDIRGAGQIYGLKQHGTLDLRFAGLDDTELIATTRQAADRFVRDKAAMLQYPHTMQRIHALKAVTSLD
jgi:ATP-dependent DNA helicase RecG